MPTYQYACRSCDHRFEAVQGFHEQALQVCPECEAEDVRKLFGSVGVVFKGPGFYRTDSRSGNGKSTGGTGGSSGGKTGGSASADGGATGSSTAGGSTTGSGTSGGSATGSGATGSSASGKSARARSTSAAGTPSAG